MIYDAARVRRLCTKFQVNTSKKIKINKFGGPLWGGTGERGEGGGDGTAVDIKCLMNLAMA